MAEMYGVETKRLNEQVKRNIDRFPEDFMFQLTLSEWENLRSHLRPQNSLLTKQAREAAGSMVCLSSIRDAKRKILIVGTSYRPSKKRIGIHQLQNGFLLS